MNATPITPPVRARWFAALTFITTTLFLTLPADAWAVLVRTTHVNINDGPADFGGPNHSFGGPSDDAVVTWDYDQSSGGVVATVRVVGTLYWDDLFGGGCTRLQLIFRNASGDDLSTLTRDVCGPGGNANNSSNKRAIDDSFTGPTVTRVVIRTTRISAGPAAGDTEVADAPLTRTFHTVLSGGQGRCGFGGFFPIAPAEPCQIQFVRENSMMTGLLTGRLYDDSSKSSRCARAVITFRRADNSVLDTVTRDTCSSRLLAETLDNSTLFRIRLHVGDTSGSDFLNTQLQTFDFNGLTGNFVAETENPEVAVHERLNYVFTWTVPQFQNWHDLDALEVKIADETRTVLRVRFNEANNSFSVFNERSGRYGQEFPVGSPVALQSSGATLHLDSTRVGAANSALGSGPTSPTVRLSLGLSFKPAMAGRTLNVALAASDDLGNEDPFAFAGTLTVTD